MWIAYAFGSALFAGLTSILAKCGIKKTDSNAATALRTIVVLVFSWLMVLVTGANHNFAAVSGKTLVLPHPLRPGNRCVLAVLLQSPEGRPRQRGRPHRQAEHPGHHRLLLRGLS